MKPRKPSETDASYIARLEDANLALRRENKRISEQNAVFVDRARPAADFTGAVLNAAAEVCGMRDDPRVKSAAAVLDALAGLPWSKEIPKPECWPAFEKPDPEKNGADCEMMLRSVYEAVGSEVGHPIDWWELTKGMPEARRERLYGIFAALLTLARANLEYQARAATGAVPREIVQPPKIKTLAQARRVMADTWMEISNVLGDLEMSRSCLRLDLRASMYDAAFLQIGAAIRGAWDAAESLPVDRSDIPF